MFQIGSVFSDINISQGNVATRLRCGGIFYYHYARNLLLRQSVKKWRSLCLYWCLAVSSPRWLLLSCYCH